MKSAMRTRDGEGSTRRPGLLLAVFLPESDVSLSQWPNICFEKILVATSPIESRGNSVFSFPGLEHFFVN